MESSGHVNNKRRVNGSVFPGDSKRVVAVIMVSLINPGVIREQRLRMKLILMFLTKTMI